MRERIPCEKTMHRNKTFWRYDHSSVIPKLSVKAKTHRHIHFNIFSHKHSSCLCRACANQPSGLHVHNVYDVFLWKAKALCKLLISLSVTAELVCFRNITGLRVWGCIINKRTAAVPHTQQTDEQMRKPSRWNLCCLSVAQRARSTWVKTQHPEQQGHMSDVKHHSYSSSFLHVVISTMFQEDVILLE